MMTGLIEPQVEPANDKTVIVRWPLGMYLEIRKETGLEEEVFLPEYVVAFALKPVERGEMKAKDK